jgi:glucokinase
MISGAISAGGVAFVDRPADAAWTRELASALPFPLVQPVGAGLAIALAEHWCGAARDARHAVVLTVGASVLAGLIVDGRPFAGPHGLAGAAAWLALNPVEREDYRRSGCLDAECSESGIVRRLVWRVKAGDSSRAVDEVGGVLSALTAEHVFAAARGGDGVAIGVVRDTARYVGMAVANLVAILDPEVVVLGGVMTTAADLLLDASRGELSKRLPMQGRELSVLPAALGDEGAAVGAARAAMLAYA